MKKRHLFAISLIGLALAACSTDDELNAGGNQSNEGAVVTLKLDMAGSQTKGSPGATNAQPGTTVENTISNVTVVVDYGTTQKVFKNTDEGVAWTNTPDSKTFKFQTPAGDATFYVYANVNDADDLSEGWKNKKDKMVSAGEESSYYANSNFFMSNQNGVGIKHTINEDTENNVTVNIERAAAKVTVESKSEFTAVEGNKFGGTLQNMEFALGNKISKFYLLQQYPLAIPTTDVTYSNGGWKAVELDKTATGTGAATLTTFTADYCMENFQTDYVWGNTTFIKFKTTFTPEKALTFTESADADWTVNGTGDVTQPGKDETAPSFFVVLEGNAEYTSHYIMKSALYDNKGDVKDGLTITPAVGGGFSVGGIDGITKISDEYVNGQCYFGPIWININDAGDESPIYRNDWYHLTVESVLLPGLSSDIEINDDNEDNPLTEDVNVTVTLSVMDWELEEREIVLQ